MSTRDRLADHRTIAARLAETIRENIITQVYAPGQALREAELAKQFEVSRIPLREALRRLEAEKFVRIQPYRGAIVTPITEQDGVEIAEMRGALMQLAVRRSLPRLADAELKRLDDLLAALEIEPDGHRWGALISEFNAVLFDVPERPRLMCLLQELQLQSRRYRVYLFMDEHLRRLTERCLRDLAGACQDRDLDAAARRVGTCFDTLIGRYRTQAQLAAPVPPPRPGGD
ncbi:MAG: GntR family transcriptional regulator [Candidatus Krumholzibacteriia bacterium]